jgi:hypothetical protein
VRSFLYFNIDSMSKGVIMTVSITSPVTGAAQTGLTSPTYTVVTDTAPQSNGKQVAVTALGGTQTGVTISSVSSPFTTTFVRPAVLKSLSIVDPVTGVLRSVPRNEYFLITRKGAIPLAGQPASIAQARSIFSIPAGSDAAAPAEIRAMLSMHFGVIAQQSAGIGDTVVSGVM